MWSERVLTCSHRRRYLFVLVTGRLTIFFLQCGLVAASEPLNTVLLREKYRAFPRLP